MARARGARKRHVQQELFSASGKRIGHGGRRRGAGRKPKHGRAGAAHKKRDEVDGRDVLHVVLRTVADVGNLRRDEVYDAVQAATSTVSKRAKFRVIHASIQHNHIHLLAEADSAAALASGMSGFQISAARRINTALRVGGRRRRGSVFTDRYHVVVSRSPQQTRNLLSYLLNNWRKHGEDRSAPSNTWLVDRFSTGVLFTGWKEREGKPPWPIPTGYTPLVVKPARSWLLRVGWTKHGAISIHEVPSQPLR